MRIARYVLCVVGAFTFSLNALPQQTSELPLDKVRSSVVRIEVFIGDPVDPSIALPDCFEQGHSCIVGTGIVVNSDGDVVTASHVAKDAVTLINLLSSKQIESGLYIALSQPNIRTRAGIFVNNTSELAADVRATDPLHDLAILHIRNAPPPKGDWPDPVAISYEWAVDNEPIFACGFPLWERSLVTTNGSIATAWSREVVETARTLPSAAPIPVYKLNIQITYGNSGGPIFRLSDQSVIGIVIEHGHIPGGRPIIGAPPVAVPSGAVADFLTQNNVRWVKAKGK